MDKHSRLKVFFGPQETLQFRNGDAPAQHSASQEIVVPLSDLLDPLADAIQSDRTWLRDFRDDRVKISKDLHEVLVAYRKLRKSA